MELNWLRVEAWNNYDGLLHGFLGRRGGKSAGAYAGLNVSYRVGDDSRIVSRNVCDMKLAVGIHDGRIITMKQVHGDHIVEVNDTTIKEAGEADGMLCSKPDAFLGVLTADCVPILFVVPKRRLVAVVHAGWRGTLAGIAAKMVRWLERDHRISPDAIEAALGPAIGACCYEIGADVAGPLVEKWRSIAQSCLQIREGKTFAHLRSLNRNILEQAGIPSRSIFQVGPCTSCAPEEFFSYRRERKETGRQMSFIGWAS